MFQTDTSVARKGFLATRSYLVSEFPLNISRNNFPQEEIFPLINKKIIKAIDKQDKNFKRLGMLVVKYTIFCPNLSPI